MEETPKHKAALQRVNYHNNGKLVDDALVNKLEQSDRPANAAAGFDFIERKRQNVPSDRNELILLPAISATKGTAGQLTLTQKYLEGARELARYWPGQVTTLVEVTDKKSTDFDHIEIDPTRFDTAIELRPASPNRVMERMANAAAVLGFLGRRDAYLAPLCRATGLPMLYVSEYTPRTEAQIIDAGTRNPLLRWRRRLWLRTTERIRRNAVSQAAGLQCSGTPTYDHYSDVQSNRLLFFDNRLREDEVLSEQAYQTKFESIISNRTLRLVYGGRFVPMKGLMELPKVAAALRVAGVRFQLDIYGDGPLKGALSAKIAALGLDDVVRLLPPVDFRTGWIKVLKEEKDLFVCCHPQGDPSSTYPEVMSCGVPIVGYANEAFMGIVVRSKVGWQVPIGQPKALAAQIKELDARRGMITSAALEGLKFARQTAFETTFKSRAAHLIAASRL